MNFDFFIILSCYQHAGHIINVLIFMSIIYDLILYE